MIPLNIEPLLDNMVQTLSGGELQRVAIVLCLAKPCNIYLIDEPSAYLDSEQRIVVGKVMKRWIMSSKRAAFVVEHDFIMATYMADKVILFEGTPAKDTRCCGPQSLVTGMNKFLKMMDVTFRRDPTNFRPRVNKFASRKHQEQVSEGNYFLMDEKEKDKKARLEAEKKGKELAAANEEEKTEEVEPKAKGTGHKKKNKKAKGEESDEEPPVEEVKKEPKKTTSKKYKQIQKPSEKPEPKAKKAEAEVEEVVEGMAKAGSKKNAKKAATKAAEAAKKKEEDEDEWASSDGEDEINIDDI